MRPFFYRTKIKPKYDPVHQINDFETLEGSRRERSYRIRVLREWLDEDRKDLKRARYDGRPRRDAVRRRRKEVKKVLRKLENCEKDHECGSPACPVCRRRFRRWFCSEFLKIADGREFWFLTYVPGDPIPLEELEMPYLNTVRKRLLQRLKRKLPTTAQAVGNLDLLKIRMNETIDPHFHVAVLGCTRNQLRAAKIDERKAPRSRNKPTEPKSKTKPGRGAPWQVDVVPPDEWLDVISYIVRQKARGDEIESSRYGRLKSRKKDDDKSYFNDNLRERYERLCVEKWLLEDRCSWKDLLVLFNVWKKNGVHLRSAVD